MIFSSFWPALSTQIYFINVLYLTIGTLLFITYGSANCSKSKKLSVTKDASNQPKKAVVEHSIRLSFHNELPKSEGSGEYSLKATAKHRPKTLFIGPDRAKSRVIGSKDLLSPKCTPKLCREAETVVGKSLIVGSEKLTDDKTQMSIPSVDFTQLTALSEGNDKQSSKTLTESTIKESKEQAEIKNALKHDKVSQETLTQNVSMSQVLDAAQSKEKQHSEAEESGTTGESIASLTEDPKKSIVPAPQTIQPG